MSSPQLTKSFISNRKPELKDLLDLWKLNSDLDFNCHHLATIQSFDAVKQTVKCTINYKQTYWVLDSTNRNFIPKNLDYPTLIDCPVVVIGGGPCRITFPISKGDQCILMFNDRDIENWFQGALSSPNATASLHSFSDAIALIGPNNISSLIQNYDTIRALITNGNAKLGINSQNNKITLQNNITTLNTLLQRLCTQLENLTIQLSSLTVTAVSSGGDTSGPPTNAADITAIGNNITVIATDIGGLIE